MKKHYSIYIFRRLTIYNVITILYVIMALFSVDDETADNFRGAVRGKYGNGKEAWGKIKKELKVAMDDRANILRQK